MFCGKVELAPEIFKIPARNLASWNANLSGGFAGEGMELLKQMKLQGFEPCDYSFARALTSCSVLGSSEHGRQLHAELFSMDKAFEQLNFFEEMLVEDMLSDRVSFLTAISACSHTPDESLGQDGNF
ncbi:hypothetical protein OIU79_017136 [Salix purpurea]|uniref:Pentatricopeptide repeat-containing protein n=1 Tax=Salix purpurea TaxID=77065 RepID=A0A9Q0WXP6_SALPP|nr:hypothetical protein OIU79_017136 [Salix purpurea]